MTRDIEKLRRDALECFFAGINAVDPKVCVKQHTMIQNQLLIIDGKSFDLSWYKNIYVIGAGKAVVGMVSAIEELLGDRITAGICISPCEIQRLIPQGKPYPKKLKKIVVREGAHPIPDKKGMDATLEIMRLLRHTDERDLVICLISGGGSALLVYPPSEVTLGDLRKFTETLILSGVTIREINTLRKHISIVKGGRIAEMAAPSALITLIISDVVGDDLNMIASGPTLPDTGTFNDCISILKNYDILDKTPPSILRYIKSGAEGEIEETPKKPISGTFNFLVGNNFTALKGVEKRARELGYNTLIISSFMEGEARDVAKFIISIAKEVKKTGNPIKRPACLIFGGETTVKVRGSGVGGRNQELVLSGASEIDGFGGIIILSGSTDGIDGTTPACGAIATSRTIKDAKKLGISPVEFLNRNDSYNFFKKVEGIIETGRTGTNVSDITIVMVA
jgi:glycerate-2-kinase